MNEYPSCLLEFPLKRLPVSEVSCVARMETEDKQRVAALERYIRSLNAFNPSWSAQDKAEPSDNFSERLQLQYSTTKRPEILRSSQPDDQFSAEGESGERLNAIVELHSTPGFGRYLVAARDIAAGEVVFREMPLVVTPKAGAGATCLSCLRTLQETKWAGCEICGAPLCLPRCGGDGHSEEECRLLIPLGLKDQQQNSGLIKQLNILLTPLRALLLVKKASSAREVVAALQSHAEERRKLPIGRFVEEHVAKVLRNRLGLAVDSDVVQHLCGIFDTNAFEYSDGNKIRGRALLPVAALMNHSCSPNTHHSYRNGVMTVRAVVDIPEGAPVTNTYTNTLWGTRARAAHLATSKLFTCRCERCLDPTELGSHFSSVKCRSCQTGLMLPALDPHADWECKECGASVPASAIETLLRVGGVTLGRLPPGDVSAINAALSHLSRVLGHNHYIVVELKYALVQTMMEKCLSADLTEDDLTNVLEVTSDLLKVADLLEPGLSRFRGILLLERCRAAVEILNRKNMKEGEPHRDNENSANQYINPQVLAAQICECEMILKYDSRLDEIIKVKQQLQNLL